VTLNGHRKDSKEENYYRIKLKKKIYEARRGEYEARYRHTDWIWVYRLPVQGGGGVLVFFLTLGRLGRVVRDGERGNRGVTYVP